MFLVWNDFCVLFDVCVFEVWLNLWELVLFDLW